MTRLHFSVLLAMTLILSGGCKGGDDGLTAPEKQMANRLDTLVKQSGGDWNKLSPSDRDYLVKDISQGSEQSARMLLSAKSGKMKATPGGPGGKAGQGK